jgi:hypothetical protein
MFDICSIRSYNLGQRRTWVARFPLNLRFLGPLPGGAQDRQGTFAAAEISDVTRSGLRLRERSLARKDGWERFMFEVPPRCVHP